MSDTIDTPALLDATDWSGTPLGPVAEWPQSLRTAVAMMMASGHAMCLAWGPERTLLYNDIYAPMLGERHPTAFGGRLADAWPEIWDEIAPLVERTFAGETSTFQNMPLVMTRHGYPEDTRWTFSYSPVRDEAGAVAGLLNVTLETTAQVRAVRERDAAMSDLIRNEAKWRRLFETLEEGFILAAVVRDAAGRVVDWRYEEVNQAWHELADIERGRAIGRTIREVFPEIGDEWIIDAGRAVDRGETIRFTRQVGAQGRWYDGIVQNIGEDRFTIIFTEVTDRVLRERRQAGIIELADRLNDATTAGGLAAAASAVLARTLGVELVGYGDVDPAAETITVQPGWMLGGGAAGIGTFRLRDFGSHVDDLHAGRTVVVEDCRRDRRTGDRAGPLEAHAVRAFVNAPVIERGAPVAMLFVCAVRPRAWSEAEVQLIRDVAYRLRSAIERQRAIEQEEVLNGELAHRIKNTLSVVQAIAMQTLAGKADQAAINDFGSRLKALSSTHDVLLTRSWESAGLADVIGAALASFAGDRLRLSGPDLRISSRAAMSLSLLLHELATNAVKYGSLSVADGHVALDWRIRPVEGREALEMRWAERGGPPAVEPSRRGFGSRIIRMGLTGSGGVEIAYAKEGLTVEMNAPLDQVQQG